MQSFVLNLSGFYKEKYFYINICLVWQMDRLVNLWDEMEDTAHQMELWLNRPEFAEVLNSDVSPNSLSEEELKKQLDKLKVNHLISWVHLDIEVNVLKMLIMEQL